MNRKEQIREQAKHEDSDGYFGFISGAEWADANPDGLHNLTELESELLEKLNRATNIRGCLLAGPGRGDCSHFIGIKKETDCYGVIEGWCIVCHHISEKERLSEMLDIAIKGLEYYAEEYSVLSKVGFRARETLAEIKALNK